MSIPYVTNKTYKKEVLRSSIPVIITYFASWSVPCQAIIPILEELLKEYEGKIKFCLVDTEANPQLATNSGIMNLPTSEFFKDGKFQYRCEGNYTKEQLKKWIDSVFQILLKEVKL